MQIEPLAVMPNQIDNDHERDKRMRSETLVRTEKLAPLPLMHCMLSVAALAILVCSAACFGADNPADAPSGVAEKKA